MAALTKQIAEVQEVIEEVRVEIKQATQEIKECNPDDKSYWRDKESKLRDKETKRLDQLTELSKKENLLLQQQQHQQASVAAAASSTTQATMPILPSFPDPSSLPAGSRATNSPSPGESLQALNLGVSVLKSSSDASSSSASSSFKYSPLFSEVDLSPIKAANLVAGADPESEPWTRENWQQMFVLLFNKVATSMAVDARADPAILERIKVHFIDFKDLQQAKKLGNGAYGEVWQYRTKDDSKETYAGKSLLPKHLDIAKVRVEFARECFFLAFFRALGRSEIASASALSYNSDTNELILLMQQYEGRNLYAVLEEQREQPCTLPIYCWLRSLVHILCHLHLLHVFHGDVAARNIMCAADGRLVLIDFGKCTIAKRTRPRPSAEGTNDGVGTGFVLTDKEEEERLKDLNGFASILHALLRTQANVYYPENAARKFLHELATAMPVGAVHRSWSFYQLNEDFRSPVLNLVRLDVPNSKGGSYHAFTVIPDGCFEGKAFFDPPHKVFNCDGKDLTFDDIAQTIQEKRAPRDFTPFNVRELCLQIDTALKLRLEFEDEASNKRVRQLMRWAVEKLDEWGKPRSLAGGISLTFLAMWIDPDLDSREVLETHAIVIADLCYHEYRSIIANALMKAASNRSSAQDQETKREHQDSESRLVS